jgi:hypothetical protein
MTPDIARLCSQTRRHLLQTAGLGIGSMALQSLLAKENADNSAAGDSKPQSSTSTGPKQPMLAPKAKRVIYLHMAGSPSQLELFEHKPDLDKLHMQDCPASFLEGKRFAFIKGIPKILAGQFSFRQYGESGQWISELLPNFASVSDNACVIRTVQTDQFNHAPSQLFIHTGKSVAWFVDQLWTWQRQRKSSGLCCPVVRW